MNETAGARGAGWMYGHIGIEPIYIALISVVFALIGCLILVIWNYQEKKEKEIKEMQKEEGIKDDDRLHSG
jgi:preprotein translocase subunit YajC